MKKFNSGITIIIMKLIQLIYIVIFIMSLFMAICSEKTDYNHFECGLPPSSKYRELVNEMGKLQF